MNEAPRYVFQLEDEFHAEPVGEDFETMEAALAALRKVLSVPFSEPPHCPPCTGWEKCQRDWVVNKFRVVSPEKWELVEQIYVAQSTPSGVEWKQ